MLVHLALKLGDDPELCRKMGDCIHRALDAALGPSCESIVQIMTEQVLQLSIPPRQSVKREASHVAVVVLMYPRSKYSDRKKRVLFGRIGEALEKEFRISRRDLVMGIIETPARNWTFGYDQTELALAMEGQLP